MTSTATIVHENLYWTVSEVRSDQAELYLKICPKRQNLTRLARAGRVEGELFFESLAWARETYKLTAYGMGCAVTPDRTLEVHLVWGVKNPARRKLEFVMCCPADMAHEMHHSPDHPHRH